VTRNRPRRPSTCTQAPTRSCAGAPPAFAQPAAPVARPVGAGESPEGLARVPTAVLIFALPCVLAAGLNSYNDGILCGASPPVKGTWNVLTASRLTHGGSGRGYLPVMAEPPLPSIPNGSAEASVGLPGRSRCSPRFSPVLFLVERGVRLDERGALSGQARNRARK